MKEIKTPVTDANQKRLSQIVTTSRPDALFVPVAVSEELEMNLTQAKTQAERIEARTNALKLLLECFKDVLMDLPNRIPK